MIKYNYINGIRKMGIIMAATMCMGLTACGSSNDNKSADAANTVQTSTVAQKAAETTAAQTQQTTKEAVTQAQTTQAATEATTQAAVPETTQVSDEWKDAYIDYINNNSSSRNIGYDLIYLDNDNIPEIIEIGDCEATGRRVVVYNSGSVESTQLRRLGYSYIERDGLLCNTDGHMGYYFDIVYSLKNGELTMIDEGIYQDKDGVAQTDASGEYIYDYTWNGNPVSKEEYKAMLNSVYDTSKAKSLESFSKDKIMSKAQVIEAIQNM